MRFACRRRNRDPGPWRRREQQHAAADVASELAPRNVTTTADHGVAVEHVEALAFALAREAIEGRPANLPAVTGAQGMRVLGAVYPR
jgi:anhydro-N-acetylmuramic acid kinase